MKLKLHTYQLFRLLGGLFALLALIVCLTARQMPPKVISVPRAASAEVTLFCSMLNAGRLADVSQLLYERPALAASAPEDPAAAQLWQTFLNSFTCSPAGVFSVDSDGIQIPVSIRCMDLALALEEIRSSAPRDAQAMLKAAEAVAPTYDTHVVSLRLVNAAGQWQILPSSALMQALSGNLLQEGS